MTEQPAAHGRGARWAIAAALVGAAALGAIVVATRSGAESAKPGGLNPAQREAVREIVRDYIRENPGEVIEALNAYASERQAADQRAAQAAMKDSLPRLLASEGAYVAGADPSKARVAVIEFFDYHCGFCKRAAGQVQELTKGDPAVKVVLRELPILREESDVAARYSLAARAQGKYLPLHFAMLKSSGTLTADKIRNLAKAEGLDVNRLEADRKAARFTDDIAANQALARELLIDGTPTFIIASLNGKFLEVVPGFRPDDVEKAIAQAKKAS